ncbi:hypothetical protein EDD68_10791 [Melghiribacillus thermohalophilus]|uniref:Uncharacterized protein n=1 Tax=Melghiribacillus thermohalophilus TaxID=1324956 RepID=A0A4R3N4R4_9BACI|nr:hypothetical protein EDD68_10791 [Melghiribacillus thermohalophilus]
MPIVDIQDSIANIIYSLFDIVPQYVIILLAIVAGAYLFKKFF